MMPHPHPTPFWLPVFSLFVLFLLGWAIPLEELSAHRISPPHGAFLLMGAGFWLVMQPKHLPPLLLLIIGLGVDIVSTTLSGSTALALLLTAQIHQRGWIGARLPLFGQRWLVSGLLLALAWVLHSILAAGAQGHLLWPPITAFSAPVISWGVLMLIYPLLDILFLGMMRQKAGLSSLQPRVIGRKK